jgi:8-oxo-dGTP pyrophosphatase MutT (NUDIX family)
MTAVLDLGCIDDDPANADWLLTINRAAAAAAIAEKAEKPDAAAFLLIRARNDKGKWRYLLQKRNDGTWGLPGGGLHPGEDPWEGAVREATEEMGKLPQLSRVMTIEREISKSSVVADLVKVGPEGYIHGYICVRPPCGKPGDEITHPDHGHGRITGTDFAKIPDLNSRSGERSARLMTAEFDDGFKTMLNGEVQPPSHGSVAPLAADPPPWMQKARDRARELDDEIEKERNPGGFTPRGDALRKEQSDILYGDPWRRDDDPGREGLESKVFESGIPDGVNRRAMLLASGKVYRAHLAAENGIDSVAADQAMTGELKNALSGRRVAMRVTNSGLDKILSSGAFKTQFETNRSKGLKSNDARIKLESAQFGYPETLNPSLRPVYAYMDEGHDRPAGSGTKYLGDFGTDSLSMFGTTQVVFKDEVKNRTTFNIGDSMDNQYASLPSRLTDPQPGSFAAFGKSDGGMVNPGVLKNMNRDYNGSDFRSHSFIEAQVHSPDGKSRPLTTDDIDHVIFPGMPPAAIRSQLAEKNIPWTVSNAKTIAKAGTQEEKDHTLEMYQQDLQSASNRISWVTSYGEEYQEKYGKEWSGLDELPKIQKIADQLQENIGVLQQAGAV